MDGDAHGDGRAGVELIPVGARVFDVSVPVSPGLPVWPGDPEVVVDPVARIDRGDVANVSRLACSSHAGTHVDAPWHFVPWGAKLDDIPPQRWIGPCLMVSVPEGVRRGEPEHLAMAGIPAGTRRLIVETANSAGREAREPTFDPDFVALSAAAAGWVVGAGIEVIGIDAPSIEPFEDEAHATHRTLLGNGVLVIEGLDLRGIEPGPYGLICLPLRLAAGDGAPARVLLVRVP